MSTARPPIVVTGGSGFIGAAIASRLAQDYEIVCLDRDKPADGFPGRWIEIDLTSDSSVQAALAHVREQLGPRVASLIHLAAYYDFSGEPSELYDQVNVRGTGRLLRALRERWLDADQFVFSSTILVHAPCQPGEYIDERWPLEPKWAYPKSKLDAERLISDQRGSVPAVLLRIAGVYDDLCHSIPIAQQIQRIYERRLTSRVYPGNTSTGQSMVYLEDLVDAFESAIQRRATLSSETVLLIGEPDPLPYEEMQTILGRLIHDEEWETTRVAKAIAKTGAWIQDKIPGVEDPFIKPWMIDLADDHYALDITLARTALGWEPKHTLREILPAMIEVLGSDPERFYRENKLNATSTEKAEPEARKSQ